MDQNLHNALSDICPRVYWQPPEGLKLVYPCIICNLDNDKAAYADDVPYMLHDRYNVVYITRSITDTTAKQIRMLPFCTFNRSYATNGLYHTSHYIYS